MGDDYDSGRMPSGLRNAIYSMIGAAVLQLLAVVYYVSQTEARFDARIGAVERQQTAFSILMDKMNDAREKGEIHMTQTDDRMADMNGKISTILDIVERWEQASFGPGPSDGNSGVGTSRETPAQNFTPRPR